MKERDFERQGYQIQYNDVPFRDLFVEPDDYRLLNMKDREILADTELDLDRKMETRKLNDSGLNI